MTTLSLNIDARGAQKGAKDFKRATDQVKTSAMQADSAVTKMGTSVAKTGRGMSGRTTFIFQNTANQLGDIAVQASMGSNMFRVLGMQLPQIAGGFALLGGSLGVVAPILGVIAAIGFPILATMTSFGKSAGDSAEELNKVRQALDDISSFDKILEKNLVDPINDATKAATRLTDALKRQAFEQVMRGMVKPLQNMLNPFFDEINKLEPRLEKTRERINDLFDVSEGERLQTRVIKQKMEQVEAMEKTLGISRTIVKEIMGALEASNSAIGLAENLLNARNNLADMGLESGELIRKFDNLLDQTGLQNLILEKQQRLRIKITNEEKERNEALKESNREAEESIRRVTREFERQLKITRMRMKPLQDAADMIGNSFERAFMSAVTGSASVKDAFRSMAANIIAELYRIFVVKRITGFISSFIADPAMFGGFGGGGGVTRPMIRPTSFDGGGYTGNGPRTGGLDGRGGFMAMLHPNETVVDHTRGNSGGEVVVNQTINVTTGVQQTVRNEIQTLLPQIAEASKSAVLDARRRGGSFANAF